MIARMVAISIGIGLSLGLAYLRGIDSERIRAISADADQTPLERRLSELETSLALQRYERQVLADDLERLVDGLAALMTRDVDDTQARSDTPARLTSTAVSDRSNVPHAGSILWPFSDDLPRNSQVLDQLIRQQQLERFISAGLALGQAQAILQREEEIELEALRARHAAVQSGATAQEVANITPLTLLRRDLGDADYARYLQARGRPTSIRIRRVLENSSADYAGLKPGDEILAYDGRRAFNMNELAALAIQSTSNIMVPVEVKRDGQTIQIYIQAGPVGVSEGGGFQ